MPTYRIHDQVLFVLFTGTGLVDESVAPFDVCYYFYSFGQWWTTVLYHHKSWPHNLNKTVVTDLGSALDLIRTKIIDETHIPE